MQLFPTRQPSLALWTLVLGCFWGLAAEAAPSDAQAALLRSRYRIEKIRLPRDTDGIRGRLFLSGDLTPRVAASPAPLDVARGFVFENRELLRFGALDEELLELSVTTDRHGRTHVALGRQLSGLRLDGMQLLVHLDSTGRVFAVNGTLVQVSPAMTAAAKAATAAISPDRVRTIVEDDLRAAGIDPARMGRLHHETRVSPLPPHVVVEADVILDVGLGRWRYRIDAMSGAIIEKRSALQDSRTVRRPRAVALQEAEPTTTAAAGETPGPKIGMGNGVLGNLHTHVDSFYDDSLVTYVLADITRRTLVNLHGHNGQMPVAESLQTYEPDGSNIVIMTDDNNVWDAAGQASGVDAHVYAARTYDYLLSQLQMNSFDGAGASLFSIVEEDCEGVDNAFWIGTSVIYCEPVNFLSFAGALDVVGHEWAHAITELAPGARRPELAYELESGALNESFSDWVGVAVEHFYGETNWTIAEGIVTLRDLSDPNAFGDPAVVGDPFWFPLEGCVPVCFPDENPNDCCGVHTNSGVPNKMFYLLSEGTSGEPGGLFNGVAVAGIGIHTAMQIGLDANVDFWVEHETFEGARAGMLMAAAPFGTGAEAQVMNAWAAVGVGQPACLDGDADGFVVCIACDPVPGEACGDCDDTLQAVNPDATEICDGLDNDCDSQTDPGFNLGQACTVGPGSCETAGSIVCRADTTGSVCNIDMDEDGLPDPWEAANGLDPTDDGSVDPNEGAGGDLDDDTHSNLDECDFGSDPDDNRSRPLELSFEPAPGLWFVLYPLEPPPGFGAFDLLQALAATAVERVCTYEDGSSAACAENPGAPEGTDFVLPAGRGVFADVGPGGNKLTLRGATRCEALDLHAGANVAGLYCVPADYSAFDWLQALGDASTVSAIQRYDQASGRFETAAWDGAQPGGSDFPIRPGEAYLVHLKTAVLGFDPIE